MTAATPDARAIRAADAGMWLFVASLVMLYAGLYSGYVLLRAGSETWVTPWREVTGWWWLAAQLAWLMGCAGAASRWRFGAAVAAGRADTMLSWIPVVAIAILMLNWLQAASRLVTAGHTPAASVAVACWFVLNGFVAVAVLCGGMAMAWIAWRHRGVPPPYLARQVHRYWTFVVGCWLSIVLGMYLW